MINSRQTDDPMAPVDYGSRRRNTKKKNDECYGVFRVQQEQDWSVG
jgi:hypothetical protein